MKSSSYSHPYSIHSIEHKILLAVKKGDTALPRVLEATSRIPYEPSSRERTDTESALRALVQSSYLRETPLAASYGDQPGRAFGLLPEGRAVLKDLDERASWFTAPVTSASTSNVWARDTLGAPNKTVDRPGSKRAYNLPSKFGRRLIAED